MTKKTKAILIAAGVALVIAAVAVIILVVKTCVFAAGGIYPANADVLDLRKKNLSEEKYSQISQALPECNVLWSVPFQNQRVDSTSKKITVTSLSPADLDALRYFTELTVLDGSACPDTELLVAAQERYPSAKVLFKVNVDGQILDQDTQSVKLNNLTGEDAKKLSWLPVLSNVDATGCSDLALLAELADLHPEWNLQFDVIAGGVKYSGDSRNVTVSNITTEELALLTKGLRGLETLRLENPKAPGEQILALRESNPNCKLSWSLTLGTNTFEDDATEVEINKVKLQSIDEAKAIAAYFPKLERLVLIDTELDDELISQFRDEMRQQFKVVWKLYIGKKSVAMSDDTWFFPTQQKDFYFQDSVSHKLRYLEDCIAVDVGDQPNLKNVEWAAYMPKLQYLILAHTNVQDISALANCKELVFLELDLDAVRVNDLSPLLECKKLVDLNLGGTSADYKPLLQMTWLEHLWWNGSSGEARNALQQALGPELPEDYDEMEPDERPTLDELAEEQGKTITRFNTNSAVGGGWRRIPNYYAMRDALHTDYDLTNWG